MRWSLLIPPKIEPISLNEAKAYLKVDHVHEDFVIQAMIMGLREKIESYVGCSLISQTLKAEGSQPFLLPRSPIQEILNVSIEDREINKKDYKLIKKNNNYFVLLKNKKNLNDQEISVTYRSGYGDSPDQVPHSIRLAFFYLIHRWYETRSRGYEVPILEGSEGVSFLLDSFRTKEV